ncbi:MAG: hypothetical protein M3Q23_03400 [Actinomycetota bacterium]|nr:hypothetical protein [Actinomycetota bacterium]
MPKAYSVHLAAAGPPIEEGMLDRLADRLGQFEGAGAAAAWGGLAGGPAVQMSIDAASIEQALSEARALFEKALGEIGIAGAELVEAEVLTEDLLERQLSKEPEQYVGVSEIADILGVSKQRVSQIRATNGSFPKPVAELAAGPVWTRSSLNHFIESWPRQPGRPRNLDRATAGGSGHSASASSA